MKEERLVLQFIKVSKIHKYLTHKIQVHDRTQCQHCNLQQLNQILRDYIDQIQ